MYGQPICANVKEIQLHFTGRMNIMILTILIYVQIATWSECASSISLYQLDLHIRVLILS